jgi:hypothetical protein
MPAPSRNPKVRETDGTATQRPDRRKRPGPPAPRKGARALKTRRREPTMGPERPVSHEIRPPPQGRPDASSLHDVRYQAAGRPAAKRLSRSWRGLDPTCLGSSWRKRAGRPRGSRARVWWSQTGSNRRPPACKAGALPTELWPLAGAAPRMVGLGRLERPTSPLSGVRSNHLSYRPAPPPGGVRAAPGARAEAEVAPRQRSRMSRREEKRRRRRPARAAEHSRMSALFQADPERRSRGARGRFQDRP